MLDEKMNFEYSLRKFSAGYEGFERIRPGIELTHVMSEFSISYKRVEHEKREIGTTRLKQNERQQICDGDGSRYCRVAKFHMI